MRHSPLSLIRVLLLVFLATVLNPSFAWDVVAGEADHEHVMVIGEHDHEGHAADHGDDHDAPHHAGHDRIGHLLSHMPADLPKALSIACAPEPAVLQAVLPLLTLQNPPEGFFRPPRESSSV